MNRRHLALPRVWMLTDERQGDALWDAVARLPRGAGVVVRHYSLPEKERQALARQIARRGVFVAYAGSDVQARAAGAKAVYGTRPSALPRLHPVHNAREIARAERTGAAQLLLSPVFPTRSHPGRVALGSLKFRRLARSTRLPVIALGGMTPARFGQLRRYGAAGWAGIDAFLPSLMGRGRLSEREGREGSDCDVTLPIPSLGQRVRADSTSPDRRGEEIRT
jgi:thiamine-phosphate pyrophosphorylase